MCIKLTIPTPRLLPTSRISSAASPSPSLAASATIRASTLATSPPASAVSALRSPAASRSLARRASAVPDASASRQPTFPQLHSGPFRSIVKCPISPANPPAPVYSLPSITIPPPIPVLTVIYTILRQPLPAPNACSPSAPSVASFAAQTRNPSSSSRYRFGENRCHSSPRKFGGLCISPVAGSVGLAIDNPTPTNSPGSTPSAVRRSASLSRPITASLPSRSSVRSDRRRVIFPAPSTSATRVSVPPISAASAYFVISPPYNAQQSDSISSID